jgi:hypothetical protein
MRSNRKTDRAIVAALLILAGACQAEGSAPEADNAAAQELGLMGTIPLYWGEEAAFGDTLSGNASSHWARNRLEGRFALRPLDTLSDTTLGDIDFLLLAQPRALTPAENVALDTWVRDGGRLLLFADPMLTGESRFAIGDPRRPQDVILLSPILARWGLRLEFDDTQPAGPSVLDAVVPIPANLPGRFAVVEGQGRCDLGAAGVLARCAVGDGRVVVLADAAVLDLYDPQPLAPAALDWLVGQAFGEPREIAGSRDSDRTASR